MKNKNLKYFSRKQTLELNIINAVCALVIVPILCYFIAVLVKREFLLALRFCGVLTAYLLPCALLVIIILILNSSSYVVFHENHLIVYRWLFSKQGKEIFYDNINDCVIAKGLRIKGGKFVHQVGTYLYNRGRVIQHFENNAKLMLKLYDILGGQNFRVVGDNHHLKTIDKFYNIDFSSLTYEQRLVLAKHYCNPSKIGETSGEKLLRKKRLI